MKILPDQPAFAIGLDVGGTKTEALVVDQNTQIQGQAKHPTDTSHVLQSITDAVQDALCQAGATKQQIQAIGIGIPGLVNNKTGVVNLAANLNLETYPLAEKVAAVFNAPTHLENDVRIAALGAYQYLQQNREETAVPVRHIAYLSIGTGIAAGLVLNGKLYRGATGMAGEIGHAIVDPNGVLCKCGLHGCLETVAAGPAIARQANEQMAKNKEHNSPLTAKDVYTAANNGDPLAQNIVNRVSHYLSRTIQWLIMSYDVEKVVLGGGVASAGPAFLNPILQELSQLRAQSPLAAQMLSADKIMCLPNGFNAGVWGAILLAQSGDQQI